MTQSDSFKSLLGPFYHWKPKKAISNKSHLLCPYCRTSIDLGKLIVNGDPVAEARKDPFDAVYTQFSGKNLAEFKYQDSGQVLSLSAR